MNRALAIGIALTSDPERARARLGHLASTLERATGLRLERQVAYPYHRLLDALEAGELDLVWLPPMLALRSTGRGLVTPLALPVRHGVCTYSTALFTRPDAPVTEVTALRRARAAWVDPQSAAGYLVIRALLRSRGLDLTALFEENTFYGSHDAVVEAVFEGRADVGATFVHERADGRGEQRAGWRDHQVQVLAMADSIPSDMLAARAELEPEIRGRLQDSLVGGEHPDVVRAATELFGAESFRAPSREHLDGLTTILGELEDAPPSRRSALGGPSR